MSTFIGQLIGFAVIVWLVVRFVIPPLRRLMAAQQESIRKQIDEAAAAAERKADASQAHAKAVADAKTEAQRVTEEAQEDAKRIGEQLRAQADVEAERLKASGGQQVGLLRSQAIRQLRGNLGAESVERAAALIRDHVSDSARRSATVDRFLDELDAMAPSPARVEHPVLARMRSASRDGLEALMRRLDDTAESADTSGVTALGDDLANVAMLLTRESGVARLLGAPADDAAPKARLVERLLTGKITAGALDLVKQAATTRWSAEEDLVTAIEHLSRQALLLGAERDGTVGDVEDQLFRFSRVLDAQPQLDTLLSASGTPVEGRVGLIRKVLDGSGANTTTTALLANSVGLLRGRAAGEAVADLAQIAVARRGEVVAHVGAAAEISDAQRQRLGEVLSRIYSHPVRVQLHVDPALLGGLAITVGDEVIDGSLSSRLEAARAQLPD